MEITKTTLMLCMLVGGVLTLMASSFFGQGCEVPEGCINYPPQSNQSSVQLVLINPVGCVEGACDDFSKEAQEYADLLNIEFLRVSYPIENQIPAMYLLADNQMSLITGIESKNEVGQYVCMVTRSQRACEKAGLLINETTSETPLI